MFVGDFHERTVIICRGSAVLGLMSEFRAFTSLRRAPGGNCQPVYEFLYGHGITSWLQHGVPTDGIVLPQTMPCQVI